MNTAGFLAAALRNPVNAAISDELFRLGLPDEVARWKALWPEITVLPAD